MITVSATESQYPHSDPTPYIVLTLSGFNLVLPQSDVYTLESSSDMSADFHEDGSVGRIESDGQSWPVVCFTADFQLTTIAPEEARVCVLLHSAGGYVGVLCEAVQTLDRLQAQIFSLPPVLRTDHSPVRGLVLAESFFGCLSGSVELAALLSQAALGGTAVTDMAATGMDMAATGMEQHP